MSTEEETQILTQEKQNLVTLYEQMRGSVKGVYMTNTGQVNYKLEGDLNKGRKALKPKICLRSRNSLSLWPLAYTMPRRLIEMMQLIDFVLLYDSMLLFVGLTKPLPMRFFKQVVPKMCQNTTRELSIFELILTEKQFVILCRNCFRTRDIILRSCTIPEIKHKHKMRPSSLPKLISFSDCKDSGGNDEWKEEVILSLLEFLFEPQIFPSLKHLWIEGGPKTLEYAKEYKECRGLSPVKFSNADEMSSYTHYSCSYPDNEALFSDRIHESWLN
ncbi:unnamed protein product [Moneuplotes crassus]|uniref:Uncharacterized protein n=1 Tax=Euplotes crassus TaxID=5936 RepID=A0AAD1XMB1_EUPCR|nr:unnamed protein product [Moneuplotes crassus]